MKLTLALMIQCLAAVWSACGSAEETPDPIPAPDTMSRVGQTESVSTRDHLALGIRYLLRGVSPKDARWGLVDELADTLAEESDLYGIDPYLALAAIYAESSFRPGVIGAVGEVGLLQVHGAARRACSRELRDRGLDLTGVRGQIACGMSVLAAAEVRCGRMVARDAACAMAGGRDCSGGLAAYISGKCGISGTVASKVRYRLRLSYKLRNLPTR